jgi:flagellar hook-basal body complex protein FliE
MISEKEQVLIELRKTLEDVEKHILKLGELDMFDSEIGECLSAMLIDEVCIRRVLKVAEETLSWIDMNN